MAELSSVVLPVELKVHSTTGTATIDGSRQLLLLHWPSWTSCAAMTQVSPGCVVSRGA